MQKISFAIYSIIIFFVGFLMGMTNLNAFLFVSKFELTQTKISYQLKKVSCKRTSDFQVEARLNNFFFYYFRH